MEISVKRIRPGVTQGEAQVLIDGEPVISFSDEIEYIGKGEKYYGENICGWASRKPDEAFIKGLLYHPCDGIYHHSDKVKKILDRKLKGQDFAPVERKPAIVEWFPVNEFCPEEDGGRWLVTLKSGHVTIASYRVDTDGDYWTGLDFGRQDCYFAIDPVIAWSPMPEGYIPEGVKGKEAEEPSLCELIMAKGGGRLEACGNCLHYRRFVDDHLNVGFCCVNEDSDYCDVPTEWSDTCDEWEGGSDNA